MRRFFLIIFLILLGVILLGCNMPRGAGSLSDQVLTQTAAQETFNAQLNQILPLTWTASASGSQDQAQQQAPHATATQTATIAPSATYTYTPYVHVPVQPPPCNWAGFIADVTIPDNTQIATGSAFTKIWRLQNLGSCTWTSGYRLTYSHGDRMNAPDNQSITAGSVPPGAMVDISVSLLAPSTPGTYQGNFLLRSSDGYAFGIGGNANESFWVRIVAIDANTATPTATHASSSTPTNTFTPTETFTPTATNTTAAPDFVISYDNVHVCSSNPYATTRVENIGGVAFESVQITIEDLTGAVTLYGPATNDNPYLSSSTDCPPQNDALAAGGSAYIAASIAGYTSGHTARETLVMCTQNGLAGDCVTRTVDFVLP